ncbi:MAG: hypothetical protein Roseis2KO_33750 [Roseivirga sp.]
MSMQLTFGKQQVYTSQKMVGHPRLSRLFHKVFGYTNVGNYARFTIFRKLIAKVDLAPDAKVLDLGAGYGEYSFSLAKSSETLEMHALDIDAERIATLHQAVNKSGCSNIKTHCASIEALHEQDFDLIFSVDVFEHIAPELMPFRAAFDRLKPGGHLIVKIPNVEQKTILPEAWFEEHHHWLEDEHIGQVYDLDGLKARFQAEGFEVTFDAYSDGWLSRLAWELAYLGKKAGIITQVISLPIAKALIGLDRWIHRGTWGNAIQVIGKKPQL